MDPMNQYHGNFAHSPGWWVFYLAVVCVVVCAIMVAFLIGVTRAYDRQPARRRAATPPRPAVPAAPAVPAPGGLSPGTTA